ncbi:MAG: alpha/beta hydrolase [Desulfovibrio sp.]|uniref:alpha/beta hydrolase n=1 Tax=Desulfovibrio sp. 7SRBS1 TaxID=3378064 RepID=UPI003B3F565E
MTVTRLLASFVFIFVVFLALGPVHSIVATETVNRQAEKAMLPVSEQAREFIATTKAAPLDGPLTTQQAEQMRQKIAEGSKGLTLLATHLQCTVSDMQVGGVKVVRVAPRGISPEQEDRVALYIHGGGYVLKSALDITALLMVRQLNMPVYSIEYRLAPEHPFPAGLNDCMAVYKAFEERMQARKVVVFGGSAGGGLALAMLLQAKKEGLPMPSAVGLFSPWSDLSRTGDSYYANEGRDPVLSWKGNLEFFASAYAGKANRKNPLLSPIHGTYEGFPPTLIITGTRDLFLSNSVRLSRRMQLAGVDAELRVWEAMFHGFDLMPDLPEGRQARREMAEFLIQAGKVEPQAAQ